MTGRTRRTVLVVGAASGIGAATAARLAGHGDLVVAADRDEAGLRTLAERVLSETAPGEVLVRPLDVVLDDDAVRAVVADVDAQHPLDALVNTVGINPDAGTPSHLVDLDVFDRVLRVNLRSALLLSQAVLPGMVERGSGRIAHVASIAGKEGNPRMASYSASKAGLIGLVKALGREYATTGVTINAIAPAVIQTPLLDTTPQEVIDGMLSRIPMGRMGGLEEVAAALEYMISPEAGFTTGFTFDLSGGRATY